MATFDQLPAEQRAIIELVVARGRSYDALADVLQVPAARVRELARDALVELGWSLGEAERALAAVRDVARGDANLLPPMREALRAGCTIGEICNTLRDEFGTYDAQRA